MIKLFLSLVAIHGVISAPANLPVEHGSPSERNHAEGNLPWITLQPPKTPAELTAEKNVRHARSLSSKSFPGPSDLNRASIDSSLVIDKILIPAHDFELPRYEYNQGWLLLPIEQNRADDSLSNVVVNIQPLPVQKFSHNDALVPVVNNQLRPILDARLGPDTSEAASGSYPPEEESGPYPAEEESGPYPAEEESGPYRYQPQSGPGLNLGEKGSEIAGAEFQPNGIRPSAFPAPSASVPTVGSLNSGEDVLGSSVQSQFFSPTPSGAKNSLVIPTGTKIKVQDLLGQYSHGFANTDGTKIQETGRLISTDDGWEYVIAKEGSYSYLSPENIPIHVRYVADDKGYRIISQSFAGR